VKWQVYVRTNGRKQCNNRQHQNLVFCNEASVYFWTRKMYSCPFAENNKYSSVSSVYERGHLRDVTRHESFTAEKYDYNERTKNNELIEVLAWNERLTSTNEYSMFWWQMTTCFYIVNRWVDGWAVKFCLSRHFIIRWFNMTIKFRAYGKRKICHNFGVDLMAFRCCSTSL
jgi:hypothetical protein